MRTKSRSDDLTRIRDARLERSGDISVIPVGTPPKVLEVRVAEGVQTIRIQVES